MASPAHDQQHPSPSWPKPVSAAALARIEKQRRDFVRSLGPCPSGCSDLDGYVLFGGLERGSVVGISAEEEDAVGVTLGLQILISSLLSKSVQQVQIVTPKPPSTVVVLLKNAIAAELRARGVTAAEDVAAQRRNCLDRIMLSRVFDMDGFCEVLADLENAAAASEGGGDGLQERGVDEVRRVEETAGGKVQNDEDDGAAAAAATSVEHDEPEQPPVVAEIQDSQDEDEPLSPLPTPPQPAVHQDERLQKDAVDDANAKTTAATADIHSPKATTPDIILVTHFSSLLTSFFTQRDKPTAHATLRHLSSRLRRLTRTLPSHPLVLIINSTDSGAAPHSSHGYEMPEQPPPTHHNTASTTTMNNNSGKAPPVVAPTLRSIFNPPVATTTSGLGFKPNKPTFGLVFTQLLDLHLLCTRAPRPSKATATTKTASPRALTVVEVLLDDIGLWQGERGCRRRREQRWTVVASSGGRIVDALDGERLQGSGGRTS
ncbi:hypothetical protein TgHK011_009110 [Trichoderma gracile]|nr:hypothetical protein TgHK011_009110 [Trichoderma gracile]